MVTVCNGETRSASEAAVATDLMTGITIVTGSPGAGKTTLSRHAAAAPPTPPTWTRSTSTRVTDVAASESRSCARCATGSCGPGIAS
jgi:type II secretory pathway predicted ATPase ExeA